MPDRLRDDATLNANQQITSANGRYSLVMQGDGNLVGYGPGAAFFETATWQLPPEARPNRAIMQSDGNFVLYTATGVPVWSSDTWGNAHAELVLQNDRNIVIYRQDGTPIWATNTVYEAGAPLPVVREQEVGHGKRMSVDGLLYRDGRLIGSVWTQCDSAIAGLRGKALAVVVDDGGHSIWVSNEYAAPTRCSIFDPSCASYGRTTWVEQFPAVIGRYANHVDLYLADTPSFIDLRAQLIRIIKEGSEVAAEIKEAWEQLVA